MKLRLSLFVAVSLLTAFSAFGQDPRGTILGQVTDSTGAAVPGVTVRATNEATGVSSSAPTNESGRYTMPFLLPGSYTVSATLSGFRRFEQPRVQVRIGEVTDLPIALQLGEVSETIEVTDQSPVLDTVGSSLGQVIDTRRVLELPTLAGNAFELALLTPGVMNATNMRDRKPAFNNGNSQISTDGSGQYNNEFQIDGVSNTFADGGGRARVAFSPPQTAIAEFKMQTATYDASYGHTIGSVVNVSTVSGTNQIHGEAHWFARNSAFDAPNFFNNKNNTAISKYRDNRYGASAGGPVYIPGVYNGKNRTFWFHAWEANKWGVPNNFTGTVPTPAQRQGDFSGLLALGSSFQIYDPSTIQPAPGGRFSRNPFPGNIIPQSRLDPVGRALVNLYPQPNQPGTNDGRQNFFNPDLGITEDYYVHLTRIDHAFSEKFRTFVRLHYDFWEEDKNDHFSNRINGIILNRINRGLAWDNVWVMAPTLLLNIRYGLTSQDFPERRVTQGYDLASLGFSPDLVRLTDGSRATVPRVAAGGYSVLSPWESGDGTNTSITHILSTNFTKLQGRHNLKFGSDARIYRANGFRNPRMVSPELVYSNLYTRGPFDNSAAAPLGQELAAMLVGVPGGSMEMTASSAMHNSFLGLYIHDDFKVSNKLTLNLGLRYEKEWTVTERFNRLVGRYAEEVANPINDAARAAYANNPIPEINPADFRAMGGLTFAGADGNPRGPFIGESNNFMPRVGFAFQIGPKTVLRGGYGMFFDTIGVNKTSAVQTGFSQSTPIQASLDNGLTFPANNANPLPNGLIPPLGAAGGLTTNLGQGLTVYLPERLHAYTQRYSFGFQHQIREFLLEAMYVGNTGTRLGVNRNINATPNEYLSTSMVRDNPQIAYLNQQFPSPFRGLNPVYGANMSRMNLLRPFPHFGNITMQEPTGSMAYHSLQLRSEKRLSRGFTFQLAYTWSKTMEAVEFMNAADMVPYRSLASLDRPHRVAASGIWEIPVGRGRTFGNQMHRALDTVIGGWQMNGIVTFQSGAPLGFGNALFLGDINNIALPSHERSADRWFNIDAGFNRVGAQQLANNFRQFPLRFSGIRGDAQHRWDLSAIKNFRLHEGIVFQLRGEAFNALNRTIFNNPNTSPTSGAFGTINGTAAQARTWQLAGKLTF